MNAINTPVKIKIFFQEKLRRISCYMTYTIGQVIQKFFTDYPIKKSFSMEKYSLTLKNDPLPNNLTLIDLYNKDNNALKYIFVLENNFIPESCTDFVYVINIKFFPTTKGNIPDNQINNELKGFLKLCLLKEISLTNEFSNLDMLNKIPTNLKKILEILQKDKINCSDVKDGILQMLGRTNGANIYNFSNYVDELVSQSDIEKYLSPILDDNDRIKHIKGCLGQYSQYIQLFEKAFHDAKYTSIFEYSILEVIIIERNMSKFEEGRKKCKNRIDKVLFHGTGRKAIANILTEFYIQGKCNQHGKGIYFTDDLDSTWIYGGERDEETIKKIEELNLGNRNLIIPATGTFSTFIAAAIYYDKTGWKRVYDYKRNPKKNEINFAYAHTDNLTTVKTEQPDKSRFYGTEYVVPGIEEQICPFLSIKLKREEYCIIWKDENFSKKEIHGAGFDKLFKKYLKERMDYINKCAKYNVYSCDSSDKALEIIKRKKYNKIILISNCCPKGEGKYFVNEARNIIGNEIITLFSSYNEAHLSWITKMNNTLFSNESKFTEKFIECFYDNKCEEKLKELKKEMEDYYSGYTFRFNNNLLVYPYFDEVSGVNPKKKTFGDLTF